MSDQRPEQTENDEQSTPTSADEYGSLTVEDNPDGTVDRRPGGTAEESDDEVVYQPEHRAGPQGLNRSSTCRRVWSPGVLH